MANTAESDTSENLVKPEELPEGVTLREHVYDGIQEYDQKLPNWWLATFYGAIIFFVGYWFAYYQLGYYSSDQERVDARMNEIAALKTKQLEEQLSTLSNERFWEMSRDTQMVSSGKVTYEATCVACHATDLSATLGGVKLPGLPLNDNEWKYSGEPMAVFKIVVEGSPDKLSGMQAWEQLLGPAKIAEVVAYIMSHHEPPEDAGSS